MKSTSIIVLVKNRQHHLENILSGIQQLSIPPDETIVIHMNEPISPAPENFRGRLIRKPLQISETPLPLAQARNLGATTAQGEILVFLDVDCIPASGLVMDYRYALEQTPGAIAMGEVYYLPNSLPTNWNEGYLRYKGRPHPARTYLKNSAIQETQDYHLFWSLNFAVSRKTFWDTIGGFDEQFQGYGAEDTDFALTAQDSGVPLVWVKDAATFHQYHEQYSPPLQHFSDIIRNAQVFYQKWGRWVMENWLQQFADAGYIHWSGSSEQLDILRLPTKEAIAAARS
jgi:GT2 family glycosyltransferase